MNNSPVKKSHKFFSLYYENDGFNIKGKKLMGRQAAGWSFLQSIIKSNRYKNLGVYLRNMSQKELLIDDIKSILTNDNNSIDIRSFPYAKPNLTSEYGGIQLPGPNIIDFANHRSFFGHHLYSLCGITHTTASFNVMNSFSSLLTEPVMPWDAIICTSESVLNTANTIIDTKAEFLGNRFKVSKEFLPQLPVIPLGINNDDFIFDPEYKTSSRNNLDIKEDDIVIIYVGRLSFHAKAHHLPMYLALEKIANKLPSNKRIHLIQTGWFATDFIESAYKEEAKKICPSINCIFLDGREQENKNITFACGDIFMSLSDNIQETFGLTPLEAMASGIPVIVSDWDGYRTTVRNEKDGFRIASYALGKGHGEELMYKYMMGFLNYDNYIGSTVHKVAIDLNQCIEKLTLLIENNNLRKKLGENAKKRSQEFSWETILDKYENLYNELDDIRVNNSLKYIDINNRNLPSNRLDPFNLFSDYPSQLLSDDFSFRVSAGINLLSINEILELKSINYTDAVPNQNDLTDILDLLSTKNITSINDLKNFTILSDDKIFNIIIFLLKYGYIHKAEANNE